jgi:DNA-binding NarL/FixJ family response regulator
MTTGFHYIFDSLFPSRKRASSTIELPAEEDILVMLDEMADGEEYSAEELGGLILRQAVIEHYRTKNKNLRRWEELTDRQKEVAAMVCLGATNAEIAQELEISLTTVKTHMREVLRKFDVRGRYQLRYMLRRWDFSNYLAGKTMNWPANLGS